MIIIKTNPVEPYPPHTLKLVDALWTHKLTILSVDNPSLVAESLSDSAIKAESKEKNRKRASKEPWLPPLWYPTTKIALHSRFENQTQRLQLPATGIIYVHLPIYGEKTDMPQPAIVSTAIDSTTYCYSSQIMPQSKNVSMSQIVNKKIYACLMARSSPEKLINYLPKLHPILFVKITKERGIFLKFFGTWILQNNMFFSSPIFTTKKEPLKSLTGVWPKNNWMPFMPQNNMPQHFLDGYTVFEP